MADQGSGSQEVRESGDVAKVRRGEHISRRRFGCGGEMVGCESRGIATLVVGSGRIGRKGRSLSVAKLARRLRGVGSGLEIGSYARSTKKRLVSGHNDIVWAHGPAIHCTKIRRHYDKDTNATLRNLSGQLLHH